MNCIRGFFVLYIVISLILVPFSVAGDSDNEMQQFIVVDNQKDESGFFGQVSPIDSDVLKEKKEKIILGAAPYYLDENFGVSNKTKIPEKTSAQEIVPESIGCWSCGSGYYETAEGPICGNCDEYEKCKDFFTVSTLKNQYGTTVATDSCSGDILTEYYIDCYGIDYVDSVQKDCNDYNNYQWSDPYCISGCVIRDYNYLDFGCSSGACYLADVILADNDILSCNGDSNYCNQKNTYCGKCNEGEGDCNTGECASGLYCDEAGTIDYCCPTGTQWDNSRSECCECSSGACCDGCSFKAPESQPTDYTDGYYCEGTNSPTDISWAMKTDYYCNGQDSSVHSQEVVEDTCGACKYCSAVDYTCRSYSSSESCGTCKTCDGSGSCSNTPSDDSDCNTIDCTNYYRQSGTESPTDTEYCYNKQDITSDRCEGFGNCKELNDCYTQPNDQLQYSCGTCKYITSSDCSGSTLGSCTNYASGTNCGANKECDGSGNCVDVPECSGSDDSCGIYPSCVDCDLSDGCDGNYYRNYYCYSNSVGCDSTSDPCNDCSCSCGGYNTPETQANGNCNDGKDNDCDGQTDNGDSGCISCSCGSWTDQGCGTGSCASDEQYQTRSCTPAGCDIESQCVSDTNCVICSCTGWIDQGCGQGGCDPTQMHQTRSCTPGGCDADSQCVPDVSCTSEQMGFLWTARDIGNGNLYKLLPNGTVVDIINIPTTNAYSLTWDGQTLWYGDRTIDKIYRLYPNGTVIHTMDSPASSPVGLAWDGEYLWNADDASAKIYKLFPNGTVVFSCDMPGIYLGSSLDWDGGFLWYREGSNQIHKLNSNCIIIDTLNITINIDGFVMIGQYIYVSESSFDRIYRLYKNGTVLDYFNADYFDPDWNVYYLPLAWQPIECTSGQTRSCLIQNGVCAGSQETCNASSQWPGCDYTTIPDYEATETSCDGLDNDCDGIVDEGCVGCIDNDNDGYNQSQAGCGVPDCNDSNPNIYPGAIELCNNIDDNCDGIIDGHGTDVYYQLEDLTEADGGTSLTLTGNPVVVAGKLGNAYNFTQSDNQRLDENSFTPSYTTVVTINFWFNSWDAAGQNIAQLGTGNSNNLGWQEATDQKITLYSSTPNAISLTTSDSYTIGQWHMFTSVHNGTHVKIYLDGVEQASMINAKDLSGVSRIHLGAVHDGPGVYKGAIDDFSISTIARDQSWIDDRWNNGTGAPLTLECVECVDNDGDGFNQSQAGCGVPDCNDTNPNVYPGATELCNGVDDDCDGPLVDDGVDEPWHNDPTICGVGACVDTGVLLCTNGAQDDTCTPGTPAADDTTCDGIDDDCDAIADEDYVETPTSCGVGECADTGLLQCIAGVELDSCSPGTPNPEVCNGLDDNCDGQIDENCAKLNMSLNQGWNLISVPVVLGNSSVASVFDSINYSKIFGYDSGWFIPTEINNTLGYWIKVNNSANLTIEGLEPVNTSINLIDSWKLIGYPSLLEQNMTINGTVFGYENGLWYNNPIFKPGYGYWVKVDENKTLVIS